MFMETHQNAPHIEESALEEYVMGRLSLSSAAIISEHLLQCDECFERYDVGVNFRSDLQAAFAEVPPHSLPAESKTPWWRVLIPSPMSAVALAAVLVVMFAFVPMLKQPGSPISVELVATRGEESVRLKSGHTLNLALKARDEIQKPVQVQIVGNSGQTVWEGRSALQNGHWPVSVDAGLSAGKYYVKVMRESGEEIQEFPLTVE